MELVNTYGDEYDLESKHDECVICLEPINNPSNVSKFGCIHSKYMHDHCVSTLSKCPLCREKSLIEEVVSRSKDRCFPMFVGSLSTILCFLIAYSIAIPMYLWTLDNADNSTSTNTTLNYTFPY